MERGRRSQAHYVITDTNRVGFEVAKYDVSRPLYIDPLVYSTYLGGSGDDFGYGIAVDSSGNAYVTGVTDSSRLSPTPGAFQTVRNGGSGCTDLAMPSCPSSTPRDRLWFTPPILGGSAA